MKYLYVHVSDEMNQMLEKDFSNEVVNEDLFQMRTVRGVFSRHWDSLRRLVIAIYLHILNKDGDLSHLNHNYVALILKNKRQIQAYKPMQHYLQNCV